MNKSEIESKFAENDQNCRVLTLSEDDESYKITLMLIAGITSMYYVDRDVRKRLMESVNVGSANLGLTYLWRTGFIATVACTACVAVSGITAKYPTLTHNITVGKLGALYGGFVGVPSLAS